MMKTTEEYLDVMFDDCIYFMEGFKKEYDGHPDDIDTSDIEHSEIAFFKLCEAFVFVYRPSSEVCQ